MRFIFNENSGAEENADHVKLLRLFQFVVVSLHITAPTDTRLAAFIIIAFYVITLLRNIAERSYSILLAPFL